MGNLRIRASKEKDNIVVVGWFVKADGQCKKHPKHRQSPGVCSLCLRDKLSQVVLSSASCSSSKTTSDMNGSSSTSSLSSYSSSSSSSASSCASPTAEGKRSSSLSMFLLGSANHGLLKSRSMALVSRRDHAGEGVATKNKRGFWSKLIRPNRSKRLMEEKDVNMVGSRSFRELPQLLNL